MAQRLAAEFGTKAEPIREERSRQGFLSYQRSLLEAVMGRDADIDPRRPAPTGRETEREMKAIDSDSVRTKIDEFVKSLRGTGHAGARTAARNFAQ